MKRKSKILFFHVSSTEMSVLLGRRVVSSLEDFWWLPGGSVEPNESNFEAAVREVHEELIPDPGMAQLLARYVIRHTLPPSVVYETSTSVTEIFFVKIKAQNLPEIKDEFVELKWFGINAFPQNMSREYAQLEEYMVPEYFAALDEKFDFGRFF